MDRRTAIPMAFAFAVGSAALTPASSAADPSPALTETETEARLVPQVIAPRPADAADEPAWISRRVAELQPNSAERKIDRIGWASGLVEAERLAKQHNRPVFLFTLDGRMDTGRC